MRKPLFVGLLFYLAILFTGVGLLHERGSFGNTAVPKPSAEASSACQNRQTLKTCAEGGAKTGSLRGASAPNRAVLPPPRPVSEPSRGGDWGDGSHGLLLPEETTLVMEATAYTQRPAEGTADSITYTGTCIKPGVVAVDPAIIPLGSWLYIQSDYPYINGYYRAEDTGGAIRGARIDIFIPDLKRAVDFGRRKVKVRVLE